MSLSNDEFLQELGQLFKSPAGGTVFLTQKRYTFGADASSSTQSGYPCIIRATNGKKVKLSTLVQPSDSVSFQVKYAALLRTNMTTLRPKDRPARKKRVLLEGKGDKPQFIKVNREHKGQSAAAKALSKGKLPKVRGSARGAGHKMRQRTMKKRLESIEKLKKMRLLQLQRERAKRGIFPVSA
ncbi:uncharacterized protein L969DRAFT_88181 [Mixia osmundae IAM 14324]|uniref:Signal recognition particle subunit SRP14 n=1 Tax=Mixia osmundae (strain CBS 9802 / IAM 14324 / JCM 22182 / KY 12970) TaxID=764103 RepID=G7E110_MIXOS|nr:uncharacterized protein L969DRAFT_88181 [Mixia osmundae IAM 14324]KEI38845.1 hypothetical protein L969DRAFT_88181 [Mixia osmundae IAM 14324]GAA96520.1 hypothetical protein E5Q_03188 [Mixia osmundae IAM 14324]